MDIRNKYRVAGLTVARRSSGDTTVTATRWERIRTGAGYGPTTKHSERVYTPGPESLNRLQVLINRNVVSTVTVLTPSSIVVVASRPGRAYVSYQNGIKLTPEYVNGVE